MAFGIGTNSNQPMDTYFLILWLFHFSSCVAPLEEWHSISSLIQCFLTNDLASLLGKGISEMRNFFQQKRYMALPLTEAIIIWRSSIWYSVDTAQWLDTPLKGQKDFKTQMEIALLFENRKLGFVTSVLMAGYCKFPISLFAIPFHDLFHHDLPDFSLNEGSRSEMFLSI